MRKRTLIIAAAVVALGAGGAGVATAVGGAEQDRTVPGPEAEAATAAALRATGGGTANSVERDGEDGAVWEVEVTRRDGSTVDVRLAGDYSVVVIEGDSESSDD